MQLLYLFLWYSARWLNESWFIWSKIWLLKILLLYDSKIHKTKLSRIRLLQCIRKLNNSFLNCKWWPKYWRNRSSIHIKGNEMEWIYILFSGNFKSRLISLTMIIVLKQRILKNHKSLFDHARQTDIQINWTKWQVEMKCVQNGFRTDGKNWCELYDSKWKGQYSVQYLDKQDGYKIHNLIRNNN